ncbi:hypothetical protein B5F90_09940 [Alistipes sp. An31A]|uniref:hypothetical protein n=1 Tax=Alistipes sp. An31A TaxID=1965631 RepID=UPI000B391CFD|nr:hypothetical protein [Alistipes sp. An31A]OUO18513.1 hypothetical protein B5F90_09940 [Alistipes sp. An31A]
MLINFSNHPLEQWGPRQRQEAVTRWGAIEDMAFPAIDPTWSREELLPLVETCFEQCRDRAEQYGCEVAFHIMGESVFCFHLIGRLMKAGYTVVASTTVRDVAYRTDGLKLSQFEFIRFREY